MESFIFICLNYVKLNQNGVICYVQIWVTLTFHFMGYFAIIFRASRVIKVMELTKQYLQRIYQIAQNDNNEDF